MWRFAALNPDSVRLVGVGDALRVEDVRVDEGPVQAETLHGHMGFLDTPLHTPTHSTEGIAMYPRMSTNNHDRVKPYASDGGVSDLRVYSRTRWCRRTALIHGGPAVHDIVSRKAGIGSATHLTVHDGFKLLVRSAYIVSWC